jgi:tRNA synthetases class I (R)
LTEEELNRAQEAVAIGCIKYADLAQDRIKNYEFSFDRMLDDKGNTAVYLLYSLARIRSIIRKTGITKSVQEIAKSLTCLELNHSRELRLAKHILKFPQIIIQVAKTLYPHVLCSYLFELSVIFSEFYEQCYCIEKTLNKSTGEVDTKLHLNRIVICEATAKVLTKGLVLLGIKILEKM